MNDIPYVQDQKLGAEVTAAMSRIAVEVKNIVRNIPCGVQVYYHVIFIGL